MYEVGDTAKYASPIEHMLGAAFLAVARAAYPLIGYHATFGLTVEEAKKRTADAIGFVSKNGHQLPTAVCALVLPQVSVLPYRVDFMVIHAANLSGCAGIVVECDGHDFHEKTKEQAVRDKARDRDLQERGYQVFRFTGSEIWSDPIACADQVLSHARGMAVDAAYECWQAKGETTPVEDLCHVLSRQSKQSGRVAQ